MLSVRGGRGFLGGSVVMNPHVNTGDARDTGLIPRLGRSSGEGNGNLLQYSCLENPMDRGTWQATVHGFARVGHDLATNRKPDELDVVLEMVSVQARGTKTLPL